MSSEAFTVLGARDAGARRCLLIGEVAQAHDGSLGMAHAFIDAIATAGADAVKFQTHLAHAESTANEPWRVKFSEQDATRRDYWKRMEFTEPQWAGLKRHADERGLLFLSSPFSDQAFDLLDRLDVPAWKIASGEVSNRPLVERMAATGRPVLLSTGMSPLAEIDEAVGLVQRRGTPVAVMQCATSYPCAPEDVGLNLLPFFQSRYGCPVGLSDHSATIYPSLAAVTMGAAVVEVHVTLSREMFGPDVVASVTTGELRVLADGVRFVERMLAAPVDKDQIAGRLAPLRAMFTKSIVLRTDVAAGTVLAAEHLSLKKPGTGLPASDLSRVIGQRLRRAMATDEQLLDSDLESVS